MGLLDQLVEERIRAAIARGDLQGLPGEGRPLCLDEDLLVPAEVRMAYRVLRNGGGVPPEILALREATELTEALLRESEGRQRMARLQRLEAVLQQLESAGLRRMAHGVLARYQEKLLARLVPGGEAPGADPGSPGRGSPADPAAPLGR